MDVSLTPMHSLASPNGRAVKEYVDTYCSVLGTLSMLRMSTYFAFAVERLSGDPVVTARAGSSAAVGEMTVAVKQLAVSSCAESCTAVFATDSAVSDAAPLKTLPFIRPLKTDENGVFSFSVNGVEFSFTGDWSINDLVQAVSSDLEAGVIMKFDSARRKFFITADAGGTMGRFSICNLRGNAFGESGAFGIPSKEFANGRNCICELNGVELVKDDNVFTVGGVLYTVTAPTHEPAKFSIKRNSTETINRIRGFVRDTNRLAAQLRDTPANDRRSREEAERDCALADEIVGVFAEPSGNEQRLPEFAGILVRPGSDDNSMILTFDADVCTAAIKEKPMDVADLFARRGEGEGEGIVSKLSKIIGIYRDARADSTADGDSTLNDKLEDLAEKYYKKYIMLDGVRTMLNMQAGYIDRLFS